MMDISELMRGPVGVGGNGPKETETETESIEDVTQGKCERPAHGGDDRLTGNLKRPPDEDLVNSKKRRKQLKPIRITTILEDMVKVPKQIIGLNNDLGNVVDLPHTVPKEPGSNSPLLGDDQLTSPSAAAARVQATVQFDRSLRCRKSNNFLASNKPDLNDLNVPNLDTGPNYVANPHFLFPLSFQPVKAAPGFWSDASLKIFNQEAYCELCKKEFCNKYFLKTHKANKHGIYASLASSIHCRALGKPNENGRMSQTGETDQVVTAYCDLCNKRFCNKYFVRRHMHKSHGLNLDEDPRGFPQEIETKIVQNSSNDSTKDTNAIAHTRDFLSKDTQQDNQTQESRDEEEEDEQKIQTEQEKKQQEVEEGPLNLIVNIRDSESEVESKPEEGLIEAEEEGDQCSSENIEKLQTMLLRLNPSDLDSKMYQESCDGVVEQRCLHDKKEKDYLSDSSDSSNDSKTEFGMTRPEGHEYGYKLDHLKQTKPTSSYCEICNKELCNKYFMRTHMQRMHGIEIEQGTQIGGVVCNICNKELCSKYFLRVHKQNTHGIVSPNSLIGPSTSAANTSRPESKGGRSDATKFPSNFTQVCFICNKRFRSPKWLQAHFISDHREEASKLVAESLEGNVKDLEVTLQLPKNNSKVQEDGVELSNTSPESVDVISKIFWETTATSKMFNCSQCPFTTSVLAFLFIHERSHYVLAQDHPETVKPSSSLQNLIHDKTFWQHKITHQIPECLDLSGSKPKIVALEQNGS